MVLERRKIASLGQIFIRLGKITPEQLKEGLTVQKEKCPDKPIGKILIDLGYITTDELYNAIALQFLYPHIEVQRYKLDKAVTDLIPKDIARRYKLIPLDKFGAILTIAMFNPLDQEAIDVVAKITGLKIRVYIATLEDLEEVLGLVYK